MLHKNLSIFENSTSINYRFQKLQSIAGVLQQKIYFLNIKATLNNIYLTVTDNFGKIFILRSGGALKVVNSKKNTSYILELMLVEVFKKLLKLNIKHIVLKLDFQTLRKKKIVVKVLQQFGVKVLCVQIVSLKAFNGVRDKKRRRI